VRHPRSFIELLSRDSGLSHRAVRGGLDDLINAGLLVRDSSDAYIAVLKAEGPTADRAEGPLTSEASASLVGPDSQRSRDEN
jgi:hypothetical protein